MVLAAETHDNGWWDWDIYPSIDDNGAPIPFTRTPREFRHHHESTHQGAILK